MLDKYRNIFIKIGLHGALKSGHPVYTKTGFGDTGRPVYTSKASELGEKLYIIETSRLGASLCTVGGIWS